MKNMEFTTVYKTDKSWYISDIDYKKIQESNINSIEVDNHTFSVRCSLSDMYIHSFAMGISLYPISKLHEKPIEYDIHECDKLHDKNIKLDDNIQDYTKTVSFRQYLQYIKENHQKEYKKWFDEQIYFEYEKDKVSNMDLSNYYIFRKNKKPKNNPFEQYVKSHSSFVRECPNTYYAYDREYGHYCILHFIMGETDYNPWTKKKLTKTYGVQKYVLDDNGKVSKYFICGKPHVEVFKGTNKQIKAIFCCESYVKAFTLWKLLNKEYTVITTQTKYIRKADLKWINEHFEGFRLFILCDTDKETKEIVLNTNKMFQYFPKKLLCIKGIYGNKTDKDINDNKKNVKDIFNGILRKKGMWLQ